ncbi:hypothetical protein BJ138DRAFT_1117903 [Hygrophoropsis aurantiaca]|uniref:Uncharacterized protein n=1 Tax=Hygrophoropsis aurantiaca TaxID=72124 RepID=A0ACB7ZXV0_9AGAM|nr:hypothetical protein BJ138DRAFT_1117903 [Hygrophoropsis aurantiaca]
MKYRSSFNAILAASSFGSVYAQSQTWCGKNFMPNQTAVAPGGQFDLPYGSTEPLLAFRCAPSFRPYLEEDAESASFVIDTPIVYQYISGAYPIELGGSNTMSAGRSDLGSLNITISIGGSVLTTQEVPLNATGVEVSVDLSGLQAQKTAYNVSCAATYTSSSSSSSNSSKLYTTSSGSGSSQPSGSSQQFKANSTLLYLPDTNGSVTKTDLRTGALWVRPANGSGGAFAPIIPNGFYTSFDQYLAQNLSIIDTLKADGFNAIHPIPPFDNATVFQQVLNRTQAAGLYLIYDMRSVYQNLSAVAEQVDALMTYPNLLSWETAHEPDGNSDPFGAAKAAYDLIYQMDGYHPISIVLNCENYNFSPYVEGADIVIEDAYPLGINATYSPVWHTPCNDTFGHCGCDNCEGSMVDIKARVQTYKDRLNIMGWDRTKSVWSAPQAFGSGAYWNITPTGQQWAAMNLASLNHGAMGTISFSYPTTTGNVTTIEGTATNFTGVIADNVAPFLVDPTVDFTGYTHDGVDIGKWNNGTVSLLVVANINGTGPYVPWTAMGLDASTTNASIVRVFSVNQNTNVTGFNFRPGGIGIWMAV